MAATETPGKRIRRSLLEAAAAPRAVPRRPLLEYAQGGGKHRVDRATHTIFGVKILGRYSKNRHGVEGAHDTEYTREAMEGALSLYEGAKVNVDHPARDKPKAERSSYDRNGKIFHARVVWDSANPEDDGIFADLKLIPSHPMTATLLDSAEDPDLSDCFGMSHNAFGIGEVRNGRYVVTEIPEVKSVDVVANAGSVTSLFESAEGGMVQTTLKKHLAKIKGRKAKTAAVIKLLEDDGYGDMASEPAAETAEDHLCNAVTAILKDTALSMEEKKKKINQVMKTLDDGDEEAPVEEDDETDDDKEKDVEECDETDMKGSKMRESLQRLERKDKARDLCEDAGVSLAGEDGKALLEALVHLPDERSMKRLIDREKKRPAGQDDGGRKKPRTQALTEGRETSGGTSNGEITVSKIENGEGFAKLLRRIG